ncbi:neuropeptides capa receptor-like [Phymastichus coffea]|uniref:neuropeptides capa receptor-like n=1 Tax=Phymastichus coffea TaxID=108790 RepID=UPI00273C399F|nr:neuropeptides capa receptor-like [Phymastichus coffea]XP_058809315.1 neuropeptides capa receptor-like [Phymastichus coffea]
MIMTTLNSTNDLTRNSSTNLAEVEVLEGLLEPLPIWKNITNLIEESGPLAANWTNLTELQYLENILGPQYLPLDVTVPLTVVYTTIFICGIFGNVITCVVIINNSTMQNATNFYLFSLAVSDLILLLLGLPNELSVFWQQYPWISGKLFCKVRAYTSETSSYVSVLTIMLFSIERYLAVCKPLHFNAMSGLKRPVCFIIGAWIVASVCALPFFIYTTINYIEYPPGSGNNSDISAICGMMKEHLPKNFPLYELSTMLFFLVPMLVIMILYAKMGMQIHESLRGTKKANVNQFNKEAQHVKSRRGIVKMLSAVVITFFICWAPFHMQRLLYIYMHEVDAEYYPDMNEWLYIISGCFYYSSTAINPLLYNFMSSRYRMAYKRVLNFQRLCHW